MSRAAAADDARPKCAASSRSSNTAFLLIENSLTHVQATICRRKRNCTAFKYSILKVSSVNCHVIACIGRMRVYFPVMNLFRRSVCSLTYAAVITVHHVLIQLNKSTRIMSDNVFSSCLLSFRLKGQSLEITYHYTLDTNVRGYRRRLIEKVKFYVNK